jgi:hypothetical protein
MSSQRLARLILAALVVGGLAWAVMLFYNMTHLHVAKASPRNKSTIASSTTEIDFKMSRAIKAASVTDSYQDSDSVVDSIEVVGDNLIVVRLRPLDTDEDYHFEILDIESLDGKRLAKIDYRFKTKFVPFDKLSKDQQAKQIAATDRNIEQTTDPILAVVPRATLTYSIETVYDDFGKLTLEIRTFLTPDEATGNSPGKYRRLYRNEALDYIKSKGFKPSNYHIRYVD